MPSLHTFAAFFSFSIMLLLIPGPAVMYITTRGASQGRLAGLVSVFGIATGGFIHLMAAVLGISTLISRSPAAMQYVRGAGALYLIYLGVQRFRTIGATEEMSETPVRPQSLRRIYADGVVVNILNPKTSLFFLSFLPQFVDAHAPVLPQMVILGATFLVLALTTDSAYALASSGIARALKAATPRSRRVAAGLSGAMYIGLGVYAAIEGSETK